VEMKLTTLETRKPVDSLTPSDLADFPVWEFAADEEALDGQDETWVKPVETKVVPERGYSLIVSVELTPAYGGAHPGLIVVTTENCGADVSGVVLLDGYVSLDYREEVAAAVGKAVDLVFPIGYRSTVVVEGTDQPLLGKVS
jgi:hypothetical protein